jgi:uncharacterized RDD family membrane protein YckC
MTVAVKPVGLGTRVANFGIDGFLLSVPIYFLSRGQIIESLTDYLLWSIVFGYYLLMELVFGRTIGKFVTFSKVTALNGRRANPLRILARTLLRVLFPVEIFVLIFTEKTLHDWGSGTVVKEV